jgi:hypothetical protein
MSQCNMMLIYNIIILELVAWEVEMNAWEKNNKSVFLRNLVSAVMHPEDTPYVIWF